MSDTFDPDEIFAVDEDDPETALKRLLGAEDEESEDSTDS
jgi:hypothetical protein